LSNSSGLLVSLHEVAYLCELNYPVLCRNTSRCCISRLTLALYSEIKEVYAKQIELLAFEFIDRIASPFLLTVTSGCLISM
jgi:hypothetical protein